MSLHESSCSPCEPSQKPLRSLRTNILPAMDALSTQSCEHLLRRAFRTAASLEGARWTLGCLQRPALELFRSAGFVPGEGSVELREAAAALEKSDQQTAAYAHAAGFKIADSRITGLRRVTDSVPEAPAPPSPTG